MSIKECSRRFKRYDAEPANISGEICDKYEAELRDISIGGASFLVDRPLEAKAPCKVGIAAGDKVFNITGQVVWSRNLSDRKNGKSRQKYSVGILFNNRYYNESGSLLAALLKDLVHIQPEDIRAI